MVTGFKMKKMGPMPWVRPWTRLLLRFFPTLRFYNYVNLEKSCAGTSLGVQWLRLRTFTAKGRSLIPGQGTKIPHAAWRDQKKNHVPTFLK